jgi:penicillin-binding protein-related factor A (putative recombinase)
MTTNYADRGKKAEDVFRKELAKMEAADMAWHRPPDYRSGIRTPALCDFLIMRQGRSTLAEVKSVEHAFRLPHKNFSSDQVARMRMWQAAGARGLVAVYFKTIGAWRFENVDWFIQRTGGSWDMSQVPTDDLGKFLKEYL